MTTVAAAEAVHDQRRVAGPDRARQATAPAPDAPLTAPQSVCPGQNSTTASAPILERAMLCMANYARGAFGLSELAEEGALDTSAAFKARDILACDEFSHFACGREFTYWMGETGYLTRNCWHVGENIAWGRGRLGTVRSIFLAWMRSDSHRENLLGDYAETGIATAVGNLEGGGTTRIWTQHFGTYCGAPGH